MKIIFDYSLLLLFICEFVRGQLTYNPPKVQDTIQKFVAVNMLNYMPISTVIDNSQKRFFAQVEKETYFAIKNNRKPKVSSECLVSLKEFVKGLKETRIWAIEMVDSFGKMPSGILEGTVKAYGDYDQCINTNVPKKFQGRYCRLSVKSPSKTVKKESSEFAPNDVSFAYNKNSSKTLLEMVKEGGTGGFDYFPVVTSICVPSTCIEEEIKYLLSLVTKPVQESLNITLQHCLLKNEVHLTTSHKAILTAIILLIAFEVFATLMDFHISLTHPEEEHRFALNLKTKCILSFSYRTNIIRLFKKDTNPDSIKIFHGMKFLTMIWIILGHTILYNVHALSRLLNGIRMLGGFFFQIAANPFAGPDTFFFISGFLVIYTNLKLNLPKINFFYYVLYRYWRLVPPIMFCIGVLILSINLNHGPTFKEYIVDILIDHCENLWWKNVLCINNYGGVDGQCMPWSWYIAVDFQLYVLCYFLVLLLRKDPKRFLFIVKVIIAASVFYLMAYYVYYDLAPVPLLVYISPNASKYYTNMAHYRPDPHIGPYCIGILMGYYVSTQKKINLTRSLKFIGWFLSTIIGITVVFATYLWNSGRVATMLESALYGGFHRFLWCVMIAWITYMSVNENRGIVRSILSWQGFVPLARLTYMAFLLHPVIIMICFARLRNSFAADEMTLGCSFIAFTFLSYIFAFVFSMICEAPFTGLQSVLIASKLKKTGMNGIKKRKESFSV